MTGILIICGIIFLGILLGVFIVAITDCFVEKEFKKFEKEFKKWKDM